MNGEHSIEVTGEDVEQALARGLEQLGVGPDEVMVEGLEEPASGMFGLGTRPARVRLRLLSASLPADQEDEVPALLTFEEDEDPSADGESPEDRRVSDQASEETAEPAYLALETVPEGDIEEDAEVGKVVLAELLENMAVRADVQVRRGESSDGEEAPWMLDIIGESDLTVLIGRKGETLASLQYITRLVTSRELQRRANIIVDVGGYKARRMNRLYALARRMADQACIWPCASVKMSLPKVVAKARPARSTSSLPATDAFDLSGHRSHDRGPDARGSSPAGRHGILRQPDRAGAGAAGAPADQHGARGTPAGRVATVSGRTLCGAFGINQHL